MYLVKDIRHGSIFLVFTEEDPRNAGYKGEVIEDVCLDYDMAHVHSWPDGSERPIACPARSRKDPKEYKVFKYRSELQQQQDYEAVEGMLCVFGSWVDYVKFHLVPPDPVQTEDEEWYDYLDKLDEDSRVRARNSRSLAAPTNGNRDEVAAWVAKKHFITDTAIREIWYLPQGSPPEEIRFLELNDRLAGTASDVQAMDFGLDIEGASFRLLVADITSEQIHEIKKNPVRLPSGWSLDGGLVWRRGA